MTGHPDPVNWRRTARGVELYDADNPDAYIHMEVDAGAPAHERPFSICPDCGLVAPQRTPPGRYMVCGGCDAEFEVDTARRVTDDD